MHRNIAGEETSEAVSFPGVGRVLRLRKDWEALAALLPELRTSATIYRSPHVLLCRVGRFGRLQFSPGCAHRMEGVQGDSLRMEKWSEAFWHVEERNGESCPCVEIADERGRGFLKLCYRGMEEAEEDLALLEPLIESEGDGWDLLHLRRANALDCGCLDRGLRKKGKWLWNHLERIFQEAREKGVAPGMILPHDPATTWDELRPEEISRHGCWMSVAQAGQCLHVRPSFFHRVQFVGHGERPVLLFADQHGEIVLTLIEPEGCRMDSIAALGKEIARRS
ncbi:hypothetical protein OKA04_12580 [Luteolibacter flavescens]|uniref:Uncharacterized protein n=1 Tax=Luteolibacter flavescens TaxID=1859460 RepID=A0ABT3FPS0_9BACT|nr:hypothetical protein [Luteolibacter flavescens]MCW1885567.1 hypothetical protein [Luteolibacter flavescens]